MADQENPKKEADELLHQSLISKFNGDLENALKLLDQAISLAHKEGFEAYPYEVQKELLLFDFSSSKDFSGLISVTQRQLENYRYQKNAVMQVDLLLTLAGLHIYSGDLEQCREEVDKAENLLTSITTEEFLRYSSQMPGISAGRFHKLRQLEVNKIREYLKDLKSK